MCMSYTANMNELSARMQALTAEMQKLGLALGLTLSGSYQVTGVDFVTTQYTPVDIIHTIVTGLAEIVKYLGQDELQGMKRIYQALTDTDGANVLALSQAISTQCNAILGSLMHGPSGVPPNVDVLHEMLLMNTTLATMQTQLNAIFGTLRTDADEDIVDIVKTIAGVVGAAKQVIQIDGVQVDAHTVSFAIPAHLGTVEIVSGWLKCTDVVGAPNFNNIIKNGATVLFQAEFERAVDDNSYIAFYNYAPHAPYNHLPRECNSVVYEFVGGTANVTASDSKLVIEYTPA